MPTFDIRKLPNTQRYRSWQEAICNTYLTVDCRPLDDNLLEGFIDAFSLGDLDLSRNYTPAMNYVRGGPELKKNDGEYFQLVLAVEGNDIVEQRGIQSRIKPGEMVIYSSTEHSKCICPNGASTRVIKIPRMRLVDRVEQVDRIAATVLNNSSLSVQLVKNFISGCLEAAQQTSDFDTRSSNGVLDILATAIECSLPAERVLRCSNAMVKVKAHIERHYTDPDLNVLRIAEQNSISVRTLNRIFAAEGTTTMRWVWSKRLAHSYKLLSEGRVHQVSRVALDSGFSDLSHFSKAFKNRYGVTPQQVLRNRR